MDYLVSLANVNTIYRINSTLYELFNSPFVKTVNQILYSDFLSQSLALDQKHRFFLPSARVTASLCMF